MFQVGVDMGGTFTDFIAQSPEGIKTVKIPSDKGNPIITVMEGLKILAHDFNLSSREFLSCIKSLVHGNTVAVNALIQRKGVKTALITTDGFNDALEMRRSKLDNQWNFFASPPEVLVPRHLRFNLKGRVDYSGREITALDLDNLKQIKDELKLLKVESVAVCLLFSFLNPAHEKCVKAYLEDMLPGVYISLSSEVAPKLGEYERTSTAVLDAYLTPKISHYLKELSSSLKEWGLNCGVKLVQNSGGVTSISLDNHFGVKGLFSGPAAGSSGARALSMELNQPDMVLIDMGGTSFDVSLIKGHSIKILSETSVEGYPLSLPAVDINSQGIGGGSIAKVDESLRLNVGPESAESFPGPACFDKGGEAPTITDAALLLGFIEEKSFGKGAIKIRKDLSLKTIKEKIADPLNISPHDAALAIYEVASAKMADAVSLMTLQKGFNPMDFALLAAGGASPIFAAKIARELGVRKIIIPAFGEVFCAQGMLKSKIKTDIAQSFIKSMSEISMGEINQVMSKLKKSADINLSQQGVAFEKREFRFYFGVRYSNQHHQLSLPFEGESLDKNSIRELRIKFNNLHEKYYGYKEPEDECVILDVRIEAGEKEDDIPFHTNNFSMESGAKYDEYRKVCWDKDLKIKDLPVYKFMNIKAQVIVSGPALIEKDYTTIFVSPDYKAYKDEGGNIIMDVKEVK
ncbi:acetophenone carboxylase gamma subunit [Oxobacter pfennigii]|uniref:Acetophenone carboxylase gamma subunit n=1 Tax=Oxobacter pfennigii TaxID=36849 RepID=A0A0P8W5C4_9CLOT|nr:hydantoinase/oxoprolinase family protein [Oxobacter pfennigii]KPU43111.1 acetophenone carboxylase gamma subunit [Oxobacter pfennigii]